MIPMPGAKDVRPEQGRDTPGKGISLRRVSGITSQANDQSGMSPAADDPSRDHTGTGTKQTGTRPCEGLGRKRRGLTCYFAPDDQRLHVFEDPLRLRTHAEDLNCLESCRPQLGRALSLRRRDISTS